MRDTKTLTIRCKAEGCTARMAVTMPVNDPVPRYRVHHGEDGEHTLQEWKDPEYIGPGDGPLVWGQSKWK